MKRILCVVALSPLLISGFGCAMCQDGFDYDSPAYGGICADAGCGGRAGSIITPMQGEMILHEKVVENGEGFHAPPEPTQAAPPLPEDAPLPQESTAESADEVLTMPGFGDVPAPLESGDTPSLVPLDNLAPESLDGGAGLQALLVPDNLPRFDTTAPLPE